MSTADNVTLIELPSELFVEIICRWIDLKSLVKMDSAACNHKIRSTLLQLFSSSHCVFASEANLSSKCAVDWFGSRKLQVSSLCLSAYIPELVTYFRSHSQNVRHVSCTVSEAVYLVGLYLRNLDTLTFHKIVVRELSDILCLNSNLQQLHLEDLRDINVRRFNGLSLPLLRVLSLKDSLCDDKMLETIVRTTKVLQLIYLGKCQLVTDAGLIAVAEHCSQLRSLGLHALPISDGALLQVTQLCPYITCLDLNENVVFTDLGVRAIAENLHDLRRLSISNSVMLTDISLEHLTKYNASTLQELRAAGLPTLRVDVLVALLQKCPHLHTLSLDCDLDAYHADIVPYMCNLKTLITYAALSDNALCMIAHHCTKLHRLGIYSIFVYINPGKTAPIATDNTRIMRCAGQMAEFEDRKYSEKGLLAILDGLPQLRVLGVREMEVQQGLLMPLAQELWRRVRPQICFEADLQFFTFDCLL